MQNSSYPFPVHGKPGGYPGIHSYQHHVKKHTCANGLSSINTDVLHSLNADRSCVKWWTVRQNDHKLDPERGIPNHRHDRHFHTEGPQLSQVQINVMKQRARRVVFPQKDDSQQRCSTGKTLQEFDADIVGMHVVVYQLILP